MGGTVHDTCGPMGGGVVMGISSIVPRVVHNTTPRPNTSHAPSPTHDHHMHASDPPHAYQAPTMAHQANLDLWWVIHP
jgi:hypothetical protein